MPPWTPEKRQRAVDEIAQADWATISVRLAKAAALHIKIEFGRAALGGDAIGGKSAETFVHDALVKILEGLDAERRPGQRRIHRGARAWDPDERSLYEALWLATVSEVRNYAAEHRRREAKDRLLERDWALPGPPLHVDWKPYSPPSPGARLQQHDLRATMLELFADKPLTQALIRLMLDEGIEDRSELAARLGVSRTRLYRMIDAMRRRIRNAFHQATKATG